ncbi:hypothetical protein NQ318_020416 [Aromia moschata]|uniref:Carboxylic ester hydrolase n=1 Tax=Aromia moschata TaxID=1265417 RepID=A0AAV8YKV4_9CUCU|nr:hypothetical protein NQ318_020416 [Aromia moschata]
MSSHSVIRNIILLFLSAVSSFADDGDPVVSLSYGKIRGHSLISENNNPYYSFQEIPYAAPPVGDLRFKEAEPPTAWEGILDTKVNTKICYQQGYFTPTPNVTETEDCLFINVYTPQNPSESTDTLLPVFVWIHGGGFIYGDGSFQQIGPRFLIDFGIVIVTFNYRLGPLGFLSTGDGVIPANLGLKDQNFAIRWVKENINLFGGDPEKITIAGESAGGWAVGFHLLSKRSEGLFRAAILQSGTALSPTTYQPLARHLAFQLAQTIDPSFTSDDSTDLLNFLRNASVTDIGHTMISLPTDLDNGALVWVPTIEDEDQDGAFVTGPMEENIKNGNIVQVPIIIGFTSEEEMTPISYGTSDLIRQGKVLDADLSKIVHFIFNMTAENEKLAGTEIRKIYTDKTFDEDFAALISYTSDSTFSTPSLRHADLQSQYTDVYVYQFSHKGPLGGITVDVEGVDPNGVGHAEDIRYIWDMSPYLDPSEYPEEDVVTRNRILKLWSNFVKYLIYKVAKLSANGDVKVAEARRSNFGNPTPEDDELLQGVTWPKMSSDNFTYLNINTTLEVGTNPKKYKEWEKVIDAYAVPPFIIY